MSWPGVRMVIDRDVPGPVSPACAMRISSGSSTTTRSWRALRRSSRMASIETSRTGLSCRCAFIIRDQYGIDRSLGLIVRSFNYERTHPCRRLRRAPIFAPRTISACLAGSTGIRSSSSSRNRSSSGKPGSSSCHVNDVPAHGRLPDLRIPERVDPDGARRRRPRAQLPQRLPPSRVAPGGRHERQLRQAHHLPVPRLDLRDRRAPGGRADALELPGPGHRPLRPRRVEQEIWRGFIFVRFAPGLPGVAEQMAPYAAELAAFPLEDVKPLKAVRSRRATSTGRTSPTTIPTACTSPWRTRGSRASSARAMASRRRSGWTRCTARSWSRRRRDCSERMYQKLMTQLATPPTARRTVELLQALAERRDRDLPGPDRLHAVRAGLGDRDGAPRDRIRAARTSDAR